MTAVAFASTYEEFIEGKVDFDTACGFDVADADVHPVLKEHQRALVRWAVHGGRRAIFAAFGLGKTVMQLETVRLTMERSGGRGLIVCPLGVKQEFEHDAAMLGISVRFVRRTSEVDAVEREPGDGSRVIYLTNYESVRDSRLDPARFTVVSLDEASVLRSFGSKTYQTFLTLFSDVPYRFLATATPSPNRYKELIHYAGYLGVMDTGQALTRFFQRDSTKANNLTLYPHKEWEFWLWLNTWAVFLQSPADLGYDATGYELPALEISWHQVAVDPAVDDYERDGQGLLYRGGALGLPAAAREKRRTLADRVAQLIAIVTDHRARVDAGDPDTAPQIVLWCHLNDEQDAIAAALREQGLTVSSIHGSLDLDTAEHRMAQWRAGETYALLGKPVMLGQGVNLQQANECVFVGIDNKFNDLIQAVHRIQRFGQTRPCIAHIVHAESETEIKRDLLEKWARHKELTATMTEIIRAHGLSAEQIDAALRRAIGVERVTVTGDRWELANNDCVPEVRDHIADDSIGLIVTSIPFANHYEYTPSYNDFGHTDDNQHFWAQMDYLTPQLHRVLQPGRIYACHVKDRIQFGNVTGSGIPTVSPFHAEATFHALSHGFDYVGMITVTTDVVRENNQTYRLSYSEMLKDSSKMGVGSPEYVLLFHKPQTDRSKGYADTPVTKTRDGYSLPRWQLDAGAFWRSSGNRPLTADELGALPVDVRSRILKDQSLTGIYDHEAYVEIGEALDATGTLPRTFSGLPVESTDPWVWSDVNRMHTLNGEQVRRNVQMHVCPLQFDIVERLIDRYSNPDDLVLDPFSGLGTVPLVAYRMGRRGRGVELNAGYWNDSVRYLRAEQDEQAMPTLFDVLDAEHLTTTGAPA